MENYLVYSVIKAGAGSSLILSGANSDEVLLKFKSYKTHFENEADKAKVSDGTTIKVWVDRPGHTEIKEASDPSIPWIKTKNLIIKRWEIFVDTSASAPITTNIFDTIKNNPSLYRCPTPKDDGWYVDKDTWDFLIVSMLNKQNILLRGDSGCGKTELVIYICNRLKKELGIVDMSILDGRTTLCGSTKLINGNTEIKPAKFAEMIQRDQVVLLDELSRGDAMANNVLLPVLDSRRTLHMDELGDIDNIKVHPECTIWATANVGSEYTGTQNLDEALDNRFVQIQLGYAPVDYETEIMLHRFKSLTRTQAKKLANMANESRMNTMISHPISTRKILTIANYVSMGLDPRMAAKQILSAAYSGKGDTSLDILLKQLD